MIIQLWNWWNGRFWWFWQRLWRWPNRNLGGWGWSTKLSKTILEAPRKWSLEAASGKPEKGNEHSGKVETNLTAEAEPENEGESASTFWKENILTEQRILNGKTIFVIVAMWINYYYSAGRLKTQYAAENTASRRYFDEVEPLGPVVVLSNFECEAAMTLIDASATKHARKVIIVCI